MVADAALGQNDAAAHKTQVGHGASAQRRPVVQRWALSSRIAFLHKTGD
jgi:hypothetical protein